MYKMEKNPAPDPTPRKRRTEKRNYTHPVDSSRFKAQDRTSPIALIAQRYSTTCIDLQQTGFRVTAIDYKEFTVAALTVLAPRAIILDFSVPQNVVQELGDFFKRSRAFQNIPLLLLLKDLEDFPLEKGLSFIPDQTLLEPFTLPELSDALNRLLRGHGGKRNTPPVRPER